MGASGILQVGAIAKMDEFFRARIPGRGRAGNLRAPSNFRPQTYSSGEGAGLLEVRALRRFQVVTGPIMYIDSSNIGILEYPYSKA